MKYDFFDFFKTNTFIGDDDNTKDYHWDKLTSAFNEEIWMKLIKQIFKNKLDNFKKMQMLSKLWAGHF